MNPATLVTEALAAYSTMMPSFEDSELLLAMVTLGHTFISDPVISLSVQESNLDLLTF